MAQSTKRKFGDYKSLIKSMLGYMVALIATVLITPQSCSLLPYKVPNTQVYIAGENPGVIPGKFVATPQTPRLKQQHNPRQSTTRQFHFNFDEAWPLDAPRQLYVPSGGLEMRAFINGIPLPVSQPFNFFAPGFGKSWIHTDLERHMLLPGNNRIDIHVHRDDARSGIGDIYIGPTSQVERIVAQQKNWMKRLPRMMFFVGTLLIIITMLGLIYGPRKGAYLVVGCLGCLLVVQASLSQLGPQTGLSHIDETLRIFLPVSIILLILLLQIYDARIWQDLEAYKVALYGFALTGPFLALATMLLPISLSNPMIIATLSLCTPLPLLFFGSGLNIWQDLNRHRTRLEALSEKVSEQAEELDEKSQVIAKAMRKRAVLEERQRFTRDIHDGIGGQLLSLLLRVRTGRIGQDEIATEIQAGLDDLRLVVDSLDHTGDNLMAALTTFKTRAKNQLDGAGIKLDWHQSENIFIDFRTPRGTLHLFRFMQEAVTNIIKHSGASQARISISQADDTSPLQVDISDNGQGMSPDARNTSGRGLRNFETRSQHLSGTLSFDTGLDGKGLSVRLSVPMDPVKAIELE